MIGIGDKVVCVNDTPRIKSGWYGDAVVKGVVYTVRGIDRGLNKKGVERDALLLEEACCRKYGTLDGKEIGYLTIRFRPVPDISLFTEMDRKITKEYRNKQPVGV